MNLINRVRRPIGFALAILFFMFSVCHQTVSAAMVGTEATLASDHNPDTRGYLRDLIYRKDIQRELMLLGIDPDEARARVDSLSNEELAMIAPILADLLTGGDATGFAVVVTMVIMLVACLVEYLSDVKMFPQLHSDDETQ